MILSEVSDSNTQQVLNFKILYCSAEKILKLFESVVTFEIHLFQ